jgi:hypothetical protein
MTITAVRLRNIDKKRNFHMATYVSAASRTKYASGTDRSPAPFRLVDDRSELLELREIPQFEILDFDDLDHLKEYIQQEMEERARLGLPAVRAQIMSGSGVKHESQVVAPRKTALDKLPAAATSDPTKTNTGRKPVVDARPGEDDDDEPAHGDAERPEPAAQARSRNRPTRARR